MAPPNDPEFDTTEKTKYYEYEYYHSAKITPKRKTNLTPKKKKRK